MTCILVYNVDYWYDIYQLSIKYTSGEESDNVLRVVCQLQTDPKPIKHTPHTDNIVTHIVVCYPTDIDQNIGQSQPFDNKMRISLLFFRSIIIIYWSEKKS